MKPSKNLLLKWVMILLVLCGFMSCVTQKRCLQKFPPQIQIKDSIILKDTTIYVSFRDTIPGDGVRIVDSAFINQFFFKYGTNLVDTLHLNGSEYYFPRPFTTGTDSIVGFSYHRETVSSSGRTKLKVDISKGKLTVDCETDSLILANDSLAVKIQNLEKYHSEVKTIQVPVVKYRVPWWCWAIFVFIIGYFAIKFQPIIKKL